MKHRTNQLALAAARTTLVSTTLTLLSLYRLLLESLIHVLDRSIHGAVSRATRARVTYLSAVAEGLGKKVLVMRGRVQAAVHDGGGRTALREKGEEVERGLLGLRRRVREKGAVVAELGQTRGLRGVVEGVREVEGEIGRVREEIERLRGSG